MSLKSYSIGQFYNARIIKIEQTPSGIMLVWLQLIDSFDHLHNPGQYLQLKLGQEASFFSIASLPGINSPLELHIQTQDQAKIQILIDAFSEHMLLEARYAYGVVNWPEQLRDGVFVCRGTGFAPVKAFIEAGFLRNADRNVQLLWEANQASDFYFEKWLHLMLEQYAGFKVSLLCPEALQLSNTHARLEIKTQSLSTALNAQHLNSANTWFYCCASPPRVYQWTDILCERQIPLAHIASDVFEYAPRD